MSNEKSTKKKILILGKPEVGKSTIKNIVFEGANPEDLLKNPLSPTKTLTPTAYSWLDLDLGVFDSAGQRSDELIENKKTKNMAFSNTDNIVYIFDYKMWQKEKQLIFTDITTYSKIRDELCSNAKFILFVHKIDLIPIEKRDSELSKIKEEITKRLGSKATIYFTSITPDLIYQLYNAFYEILSGFSEKRSIIKDIIDQKMKDASKTMVFITNSKNSIVAQSMTHDFNTNLINDSHNLMAQVDQTLNIMKKNDKIDHVLISTLKNLNIILKYLDLLSHDLKNVVCVSETIDANKIIWMIGDFSRDLNRKFKYNR